MTALEFILTMITSIVSLVIALWAVKISLKGNSLLMTMTKSIQAIESKSRAKRRDDKASESTKQREIRLKEQAEQRKTLELELKQKQQEWKKKKDVANLIRWFLDRLEND